MHTLQVRMSTSGVVIHCTARGCQSPKPQEINCFKCQFCAQFARRFSGTYAWRTTRPACNTFIKRIFHFAIFHIPYINLLAPEFGI